jgi:hypothetical protein
MMSDERFFNQVKATMSAYSPEVPAAVYGGMRRKLWWRNFTKLSATRLNVWYLALALGTGAVVATHFFGSSAQAERSGSYNGQPDWSVSVANTSGTSEISTPLVSSCASACVAATAASCSASSTGKSNGKVVGSCSNTVNASSTASADADLNANNSTPATGANGENNILASSVDSEIAEPETPGNTVLPSETQNTPAVSNTAGKKKMQVSVYKNNEPETAVKK